MSDKHPIRKQFSPLAPYQDNWFTWFRTGQVTHRIGKEGVETPLSTNHSKESERKWFITICMNHLGLEYSNPEHRKLFPSEGQRKPKPLYQSRGIKKGA